ncbi:MAG: DEAD/DEAH box helicase family protein [Candidatus Heimdallarchaeota archaeon]|nr:DEAD/DEAH box helicase family protein [Candidatus Heimdallarchaeota archaeon]
MSNVYTGRTDKAEENYTFCPNCGKILIIDGKSRCKKCGSYISVNDKEEKGDVLPQTDEIEGTKVKIKEDISSATKEWEKYFPYLEIRPLQKQIIETIQEKMSKGSQIIIQAANGVGKTISLLAAVLPIAKEKKKTIVYCCRTHQQMSRVVEELKLIKQLNQVSGLALRGRKELCLHHIIKKFALDAANAADICRYLKKEGKCKYFNNLANKTKLEKVNKIVQNKVLDSQELIEIGKNIEVCPFEISIRTLPKINVVTTSYQYVFNPFIRKILLANLEKELSDLIVIVDEAHNLPSTAVDISSSNLSNYSIDNALSEAMKHREGELYDFLESLSATLMNEIKSMDKNQEIRIDSANFISTIERRAKTSINKELIQSLQNLGDLVKEQQMKQNKAPLSYASAVANYLSVLIETKDQLEFAHFLSKGESKTGNPIPRLVTLSLDPRTITEEVLTKSYATILASGTLEPIDSYISLIGLDSIKVESLLLPSPYKDENHITLVIDKLSSKLEDRTPSTYASIVDIIEAVAEATPKNIGIFCASYTVMESLIDSGLEKKISKPLYITHRGMTSSETDDLINDFKNESKFSGGVLISVLGGRSSEGSDYPASQMQSVVVVGIPYAKPTPSVNASIEYLESQFPTKGREFGYNIPALTRAAQAAGRPIRSLEDYAAIILLDYRFARHYYKKHLPNWLRENFHVVQPEAEGISERLKKFFEFHNS